MRCSPVWILIGAFILGSCGGSGGPVAEDGGPVDDVPRGALDIGWGPDTTGPDLVDELPLLMDFVCDGPTDSSPPVPDSEDPLPDAAGPDLTADLAPELLTDIPPDVPPPGPGEPMTFAVLLSAPMIEKASEGGEVQIQCLPLDGIGMAMEDPGDVVITAAGGVLDGVTASFAEPGTWSIHCASEGLGVDGAATVEVVHDAVDRKALSVAARLGELHGKMAHLAAAAGAEDSGQLDAVAGGLTALAAACTADETGEALIPFPGGWPSPAQLEAAGLGQGPDDEAFAVALSGVLAAAQGLQETLAQLDSLDEEALEDWAEAAQALAALEAEFAGLEPSPAAVMAALDQLEALSGPVMDSLIAQTALTAAALASGLRDEVEGYETIEAPLSLTGMLVSFAVQQVLATIPTYNGLLKDVGKALSQMVVMLALQDIIEGALPLPDNPPVIFSIHGSAAGFVTPGNPWIVYGEGFHADPGLTVFLFIAPEFSAVINDAIWGLIDLLQNIKGLLGEENVFTAIKTAKDILDGIKALADGVEGIGGWEHMVLSPESVDGAGGDMFLSFPALPTGVNCSFLPQPGLMFPVNLLVGRGESMAVNVIQEGAGACN